MVDRILRFLIPVAAVLTLCPAACAEKRWNAPRVVTWSCSGCHGIDGNAQPPYFPRLAGLNALYAEQRIAEFRSAVPPPVDELFSRFIPHAATGPGASRLQARINMSGMAHAITADETKASVAWYATQKPAPGRSGSQALIQRGKLLFLNGLAAQGIPACQTCHGAHAEGKAKIPRLAGQNGRYLLGELAKFHDGYRQHAPEMTMVAEHVDNEQFQALVEYLQSL